MKTSQFLLALTPLSLLVSAAGTHAQTAVGLDAGALRQQIDQQREVRIPQALPAKRVAPPPEIKPQAGVSIKIKSIRFEGNTLLKSEQLAPTVVDFIGREVGFDGLQRATDAVAAAYRQAGWIVRVYLLGVSSCVRSRHFCARSCPQFCDGSMETARMVVWSG
jgi:hemolysin activation/secretion protein